MGTSPALRLARLLLVAAGALTFGTAAYIVAQTSSVAAAAPWLLLLAANGAAFVAAAIVLARDPTRGVELAVGAALTMAALGTVTGMGAGLLGFPAMALGALGAWAAIAARAEDRRRVLYAFLVYVAIGLALTVPTAGFSLAYIWALALVVVWPIRLFLLPMAASFLGLYVVLALGIGALLLVLVRRRAFTADLTVGLWLSLGALSVLVGVAALAFFNVYAIVRTNTSARFELDGLVLLVVFAGGLLTALGVLVLRLAPSAFGAFALSFGVVALFLAFGHAPAVTCRPGGGSTSVPLAWELHGAGGGPTTWTSGGSRTVAPGTGGNVQTGELRQGDRVATYRCEGDLLVDYREVK